MRSPRRLLICVGIGAAVSFVTALLAPLQLGVTPQRIEADAMIARAIGVELRIEQEGSLLQSVSTFTVSAGGPIKCFRGQVWRHMAGPRGPSKRDSAVRLIEIIGLDTTLRLIDHGYQPLDVIFVYGPEIPQLLCCAMIWGSVIMMMWGVAEWAYRRLRTMRGRCGHCGYILSGRSSCPECGSDSHRARPNSMQRATP